MSNIIQPVRWWDMVSPQGEQEMIPFLRAYMGKGKQFRTPKRMWEDLWRLKRGEMNQVMGMRKFDMLGNFKGPKYQKGMIAIATAVHATGGTEPNLQNITHTESNVSPAQSRISIWYDSDGGIEFWSGTGGVASVLYAPLTTQSDDSNNHTNDWWPDQNETNEGLNWDIRYTALTAGGAGGIFHYFQTTVPADRVEDTWYLLDTVSNDAADATDEGAMGFNRANGTAKNPSTGTATLDVDVEIRATGSGSAVASHTLDLAVTGT